MPLTNIQEQVLEHVWREGKKCRGGVPTQLVVVQLAHTFARTAVIGTLHDLKGEELVSVTGADEVSRGWMATTKGHAALALDPADLDPVRFDDEQPSDFVSHGGEVVLSEEAIARMSVVPDLCLDVPHRVFSQEEIAKVFRVPGRLHGKSPVDTSVMAKRKAEEFTSYLFGKDRISTELLNRCATMNATLLAQAEQAYAAGDTDAWRDLAWLMETGRQLVAIGGEV